VVLLSQVSIQVACHLSIQYASLSFPPSHILLVSTHSNIISHPSSTPKKSIWLSSILIHTPSSPSIPNSSVHSTGTMGHVELPKYYRHTKSTTSQEDSISLPGSFNVMYNQKAKSNVGKKNNYSSFSKDSASAEKLPVES